MNRGKKKSISYSVFYNRTHFSITFTFTGYNVKQGGGHSQPRGDYASWIAGTSWDCCPMIKTPKQAEDPEEAQTGGLVCQPRVQIHHHNQTKTSLEIRHAARLPTLSCSLKLVFYISMSLCDQLHVF